MANRNPVTQLQWRDLLIFFGPLIVMYTIFYAFSTGFLTFASLQKISMTLGNGRFVGLENFSLLLTDRRFLTALINNFLFAGVSVAAALTIGFFVAVTLSTVGRGRTLLYVVFLLPTLMPLALVASVFRMMLEARFGSVNATLTAMGLGALAHNWLIEPQLAYAVVCVLFVYIIGLPVLYYTANLSTINTSIIEAAVIDGAKTWRLYAQILFPVMRGTHLTIITSTVLTSFRAFDIVFFSTGGGPAGRTEITGTYVYGFSTSGTNVGYGSAAAALVLFVTLLLGALNLTLLRRGKAE